VSSGDDIVTNGVRVTSANAFAKYSEANGITWNLAHNRSSARTSSSETKLDTTSLSAAKTFNSRLSGTMGFDLQNGVAPHDDGTGTKPGSVALQTLSSRLSWVAAKGLTFDGRAGLSKINAFGENGDGTDLSFNAAYRPTDVWNVSAGYTVSDSGALATLGSIASASGVGYGGNGFSSGALGSGAISGGQSNTRLFQVATGYRASDRLNLNARYYTTRSEGGLSSNAQTRAYGLGVEWDLGGSSLLSTSLDRTTTGFFDTAATSATSTTITAALASAPPGPWSYRLGISSLVSGGSSTYAQDSLQLDATLSYRISRRQRSSIVFNRGNVTGYYGQNETSLALLYSYQIYRNIALVSSYRFRNVSNLDASLTSGAYRSHGFDLELSFDFAP